MEGSTSLRSSLAPFLLQAALRKSIKAATVSILHGASKDGTKAHDGWVLKISNLNSGEEEVSTISRSSSVEEVFNKEATSLLTNHLLKFVNISRLELLKGEVLNPMAQAFVTADRTRLKFSCWQLVNVDSASGKEALVATTLAHTYMYESLPSLTEGAELSPSSVLKGFRLKALDCDSDRAQSGTQFFWLSFPGHKDPSAPSAPNDSWQVAKMINQTASLQRGVKDIRPENMNSLVAAAGHYGVGTVAEALSSDAESQKVFTDAEEAMLDYRLLVTADRIHQSKEVSVVLLSGPSASGKSSIANRLALALRSLGDVPCLVTLDDYYRDPKEPTYPKMPDGVTLNHELVECLRIERFQDDMKKIIELAECKDPNAKVQLPRFDFVNQCSLEDGPCISVAGGGGQDGRNIVIVEGIFSLNPKLTSSISKKNKFGVFTSPLGMNIDEYHRVTADDLRLLRRIHRDFLHRGRDARTSLARTPGVAAGALESIFPFLSEADAFIDGGMMHEAWLLKFKVSSVLATVSPDEDFDDGGPLWLEAQRLQNVLSHPIGTASSDLLPSWSVLEEFLGTPYTAKLPESADTLQSISREESKSKSGVQGKHARSTADIVEDLATQIQYRLKPELDRPDTELVGYICHSRLCSPFEEVPDGAHRVLALHHPKGRSLLAPECNPLLREGKEEVGGDPTKIIDHQECWVEQVMQETAKFALGAATSMLAQRGTLSTDKVLTVSHNYLASGTKAVNACYASWCSTHDGQDLKYGEKGEVTETELQLISQAVNEVLQFNSPIGICSLATEEAIRLLQDLGRPMSAALVASLQVPLVQLAFTELPPPADADDSQEVPSQIFATLYTAPIAGSTGCATGIGLSLFDRGVRVSFDTSAPTSAVPLDLNNLENDAASKAYMSHRNDVATAMSVSTTAKLNYLLMRGIGKEDKVGQHLSHLSKALHKAECFRLAQDIANNRVQAVAVAGGSASGKSVFVSELSFALNSLGVSVTTLSLDHYYMNADDPNYPLVPGSKNKNYETVDALRIDFLNNQLDKLLAGDTVETPIFDLGQGKCTSKTVRKVIPKADKEVEGRHSVLIIESLFALSSKIMPSVAKENRRKIMLLPLPFIQLDELHPTDSEHLRILRRVHRDALERGRSAAITLQRAAAVGHGELENTLPFICDADIVVSTTSMMEFHTMASECIRLLKTVNISDGDSIHSHAHMIRSYLEWFQPLQKV